MSCSVLGIDLGTTNSAVAVADEAGVRVLPDAEGHALIPSVVSFHPSREILVGRPARDRRMLDAHNTVYSIKRLIGRPFGSEEVRRARERFPFELREGPTGGVLVAARGETYTLSEISAFVLRQVRAQAEASVGQPCSKAVVTVPANFNELQRSATKAAGRVAGLEVLRILNEPTAAALAYGYGRGSRERIAIFDLGGGTFDITILELAGDVFEVLATAGDTYLGGDDIDTLIADQMADAFLESHRYDPREDAQAFERLRIAAEWAKCKLSSETDVQVRVEELAYGSDGVPLDLTIGLTRQALEASVRPLVARAFDVCEDAMRVAGVRPTQLDNVILVGGATRMPLVRGMVGEYFGQQALADIDPDLVVAQGAAIQARTLAGERPAPARALGRVALKKRTLAEVEAASDTAAHRVQQRRQQQQARAELPYAVAEPSAEQAAAEETTSVNRPSYPSGVPSIHDEPTAVRASPYSEPPGGNEDPTAVNAAPPPPPPPPPPSTSKPPAEPPPPPPSRSPSADDVLMAGSIALSGEPAGAREQGAEGAADGVAGPPVQAPEPPPSPPLLLDVTPMSLGVETVSGYCEHIIRRNAAIPVEQTRTFSTARDGQETVRVQICQGESRRLDDNQLLGEIELAGLRPAPRGQVQVGVTFLMGADGTLDVRATDLGTGREQSVRINLIGGMDEQELDQMQQRHEQRFRAS